MCLIVIWVDQMSIGLTVSDVHEMALWYKKNNGELRTVGNNYSCMWMCMRERVREREKEEERGRDKERKRGREKR